MAIDYTTPTGQVRLLTADLDPAAPLLDDEMLQGYLAMHDGNTLRAAASALDAVATSEVLVSKKIRTQDLSTDGPAAAAELRKQADALRGRADVADLVAAGSEFEIIPLYGPTGYEAAERHLP